MKAVGWFQILSYSSFAVNCRNRISMQFFSHSRIM